MYFLDNLRCQISNKISHCINNKRYICVSVYIKSSELIKIERYNHSNQYLIIRIVKGEQLVSYKHITMIL
ncbi:hypothetical protein Pint_11074 [Pistacia integerrima]|uniref:Uncharacterized protein n=1 Tax=Pistacia integerrima TaxID=434235 RepID=A0ACC0XI92_9ROSI|nr:hypothetical protein Pint_11074 [Pistacia integerrima]